MIKLIGLWDCNGLFKSLFFFCFKEVSCIMVGKYRDIGFCKILRKRIN